MILRGLVQSKFDKLRDKFYEAWKPIPPSINNWEFSFEEEICFLEIGHCISNLERKTPGHEKLTKIAERGRKWGGRSFCAQEKLNKDNS